MDVAAVREAVAEMAGVLQADGADLVLVRADPATARIEVRLEIDGADCRDCVLPAPQLELVVADAIRRRVPTEFELVVDDPRSLPPPARPVPGPAAPGGRGSAGSAVTGAEARRRTLLIRVPTAKPRAVAGAPAYRLDRPIAGLRVGLRHEGSWRSWLLIVDEWEKLLRRDGAEPVVVQAGGRVGAEGERTRAEIERWAKSTDCGVSGLGTCGSCTANSVLDAVALEDNAKPAVVAVTAEFSEHGRNMARFLGHPSLKILVLPYPLEARPEEELRRIAADYYPRFLELLGAAA
jgi:hypothetical protein